MNLEEISDLMINTGDDLRPVLALKDDSCACVTLEHELLRPTLPLDTDECWRCCQFANDLNDIGLCELCLRRLRQAPVLVAVPSSSSEGDE